MTAVDERPSTYDGVIEILDRTGDTKITWSRSNRDEVEIARAAFDKAKASGAMITDKDGNRVTTFDPNAERLLAVPRLVGG